MDSKALAARLSKKYETRDPFRLENGLRMKWALLSYSHRLLICVGSSSASSGKI